MARAATPPMLFLEAAPVKVGAGGAPEEPVGVGVAEEEGGAEEEPVGTG
jgi:hypothetical protein